jgi:hypothetical protein
LLDGAKLEGNPFTGQFSKDAGLRRLELRSTGRVTEARMIRLDQDLDLLIALPIDKANPLKPRAMPVAAGVLARPSNQRLQEPVAAAAPMPAPAPAPAAGTPMTRRPSPAAARPIDDSDPYSK